MKKNLTIKDSDFTKDGSLKIFQENLDENKNYLRRVQEKYPEIDLEKAHEDLLKFLIKKNLFHDDWEKKDPYLYKDFELLFWRMAKNITKGIIK